ncbi:MAG: DNA repair protein RecN [Oscillospiraceae bacterium]|nr:DNA repair protein RecN [Oscillospiraceae bacterium]
MIKLLHIENIAVIEKADIEFTKGLNVLTGETGAGKSIVIDSLSAATGSRTSRDIIRTGADYAAVTAVFQTEQNDGSSAVISDWLSENGIEPDESGEIYINRKITADGKTTCRINGTPVQTTKLRDLGLLLIDIHGQNDGRKLLDENVHLEYLDTFGFLEKDLNLYKEAYSELRSKKSEIDRLSMDESEKERRIDTLKFQIEEIERSNIKPGELNELISRRELLLNASKLTDSVETAYETLHGGRSSRGGDTVGIVALIGDAYNELNRVGRYSEELRILSERLNDMRHSAEDISNELRDLRSGLDFSPGELETIDERMGVLKRIVRKYGSEEEALNLVESNNQELSEMADSDNKLIKLEEELQHLIKKAKKLAIVLSEKRKKAAKELQDRVMKELSQLSMPGVDFIVVFDDVKTEYELNTTGADEVWYLMSANAGEAPGRINRIASGGELARIMLALKNVLSSNSDTASMVFDEVDTGVSGIAAQRVGEKLAALAKDRQVLCVTHLPQIAVMADTHFSITKSVSGGRTYTNVESLDFDSRKKELARLSGGENITPITLESAAEQLKAAEEFKASIVRF